MSVMTLPPVLEHYLNQIGASWLSCGATSFDVISEGQIVRHWGKPLPELSFEARDGDEHAEPPLRAGLDDRFSLQLNGISESWALERLKLDSSMVKQLVQRDGDLELMTIDLIENQDQLLALYDMTRSTRLYLQVPDTLKFMAQEASRLIHTQAAFASLQLPNQPMQVLQHPAGFLPDDVLEVLSWQLSESSRTEFLLSQPELTHLVPDQVHTMYVRRFPVRAKASAMIGIINKLDGEFKSPDLKLAGAIADCTAAYLENALLAQENMAQMRLQAEMDIAHQVQAQLLSTAIPKISGLDLAAQSRPARELGGDFYEMMPEVNPFTFSLGDVSGKGAPAAMLMAVTRTALRTHTRFFDNGTPASILGRANDDLYSDMTASSMFATVFLGQYRAETSDLVYANAGHSPVMYCSKGQPAILLEADAPPLGVLNVNLCEDHFLKMNSGDVLVIASDGLNEAVAPDGGMFGLDRLLNVLTDNAHLPAADLLARLLIEVETFTVVHERTDDQTVLVVKKI